MSDMAIKAILDKLTQLGGVVSDSIFPSFVAHAYQAGKLNLFVGIVSFLILVLGVILFIVGVKQDIRRIGISDIFDSNIFVSIGCFLSAVGLVCSVTMFSLAYSALVNPTYEAIRNLIELLTK